MRLFSSAVTRSHKEFTMKYGVFMFRRGTRLMVCMSLAGMALAWAAATPSPDNTAGPPSPASPGHGKPGAKDPNWRSSYVQGAGILAAVAQHDLKILLKLFCGGPSALAAPETFMQEYGRSLVRLCAHDAHLATCRSLPGAARYELIGRLIGTNAVRVGVAFGCNRAGLIETLTFDQPVPLPGGAVNPAGTAVPVETVMRMLALTRTGSAAAVQDLAITRATSKISYANPDSTKAKFEFMVRGSAPTMYRSFIDVSLTQFAITPMPMWDTNVVAHMFSRMLTGLTRGKQPKYVHYFVTYDFFFREHKNGVFIAKLHDGMIDFLYKMKLDNRPGDMVSAANYEALQAYTSTNPPLRGLGFGSYIFRIGSETHVMTNVPLFSRVTKGSSSTTKVKLKAP